MASQEARQRKGAVAAPKSGGDAALFQVSNAIARAEAASAAAASATAAASAVAETNGDGGASMALSPTATGHHGLSSPRVAVATVKRNKFGTGPFDENWLNLDCCGLFCALMTYGLHLYGIYAVCLVVIPPWMSTIDVDGVRHLTWAGHANRLAFTMVAILAIYAHFKAMTSNPGAVPPDAIPLDEADTQLDLERNGGDGDAPLPPPRKGRRLCRRCNAYKPKRAHHCSICKRCVVKMDHHCPWVNNCVGIGNHKYFLLFVFYTCLSCIYSLTLIGVRFFDCMGRHGHVRTHHMTCLDRPTQLLNVLGLFVEAILFGLFTSCMMIDQSGVVMTKMTHIDRLKGGGEDSASAAARTLSGVVEVFGLNPRQMQDGSRFRTDWLSPFHRICFPSSVHDEIMGFCRPCMGGNRDVSSHLSPDRRAASDTEMAPMLRSVAEIL